jgi:hypothetical protein
MGRDWSQSLVPRGAHVGIPASISGTGTLRSAISRSRGIPSRRGTDSILGHRRRLSRSWQGRPCGIYLFCLCLTLRPTHSSGDSPWRRRMCLLMPCPLPLRDFRKLCSLSPFGYLVDPLSWTDHLVVWNPHTIGSVWCLGCQLCLELSRIHISLAVSRKCFCSHVVICLRGLNPPCCYQGTKRTCPLLTPALVPPGSWGGRVLCCVTFCSTPYSSVLSSSGRLFLLYFCRSDKLSAFRSCSQLPEWRKLAPVGHI